MLRTLVCKVRKSEIGTRLGSARRHLGIPIDAFSTQVQIPVSTLKKYESGFSTPGGEAIQAFVLKAGINATWLLTGSGPMLLKDLPATAPSASPDVPIDMERLQLAIETVEEGLEMTRRVMKPHHKAELIVAVYDLFSDTDDEVDKGVVLRLVKSAS